MRDGSYPECSSRAVATEELAAAPAEPVGPTVALCRPRVAFFDNLVVVQWHLM